MRKKLHQWLDQIGDDALLRLLVWVIILSGLGSLFINLMRAPSPGSELAFWWEGWLQQVSGEAVGALVTLIVVDWLLQRRAKQQSVMRRVEAPDDAERKAQHEALIGTYRTRLRATPTKEARQAILDEMKREKLLPGASLNNLNLAGANFYDADLRGISFENCDLTGAYFIEADLRGAKLTEATLTQAELSWADLSGAFLGEADLRGAWLLQANLEQAYTKTAKFDLATRLPDGRRWADKVEIDRFSDPKHAQFWRPEPGLFGELPRWYRRKTPAQSRVNGVASSSTTAVAAAKTEASVKPSPETQKTP